MGSYQVTVAEFDRWQTKIAKLNRRAVRKGFPGRVELTGELRQLCILLVDLTFQRGHLAPKCTDLLIIHLKLASDMGQALALHVDMRGYRFSSRDFFLQAFKRVLMDGDGAQ